MKRCLECRHFSPITEIYGKCTIADEKIPTKLANNHCQFWTAVKDRKLRILRLMEAQEEVEV